MKSHKFNTNFILQKEDRKFINLWNLIRIHNLINLIQISNTENAKFVADVAKKQGFTDNVAFTQMAIIAQKGGTSKKA